ncbi:alpha/beta hydrolase [Rhizobium tubonense]|uniref:BD-FAE-like domain-containing protein n=1 Tax=Rhizobium tubonense TaxID=484088 RepID=A0A2W4F6E5_9HYPH|nr:alpha/beta hydrolase [Rhizobium tubonense]PZM17193.1 hypothetical protein CPY51_02910 [Rhizobium tubonense]
MLCLCVLVGMHLAFAGLRGPEIRDIAYGPGTSNRMDIYKPSGAGPFPVIIYIHGGGWWNGDKRFISRDDLDYMLSKGVAVAAINYRNLVEADRDRIFPPVLAPLEDTKAAYEYLVRNGAGVGIDGRRIAAYGGSAGGFNALWLGLSLQKNQPAEGLRAIGGIDAQTTIDPFEMRDWVSPSINYGGHAFGLPEEDFSSFLARRENFLGYIAALSPSYLVGAGSPPTVLLYSEDLQHTQGDHMSLVHSPQFGSGFARAARKSGQEVTLLDGASGNRERYTTFFDFLIAHVLN